MQFGISNKAASAAVRIHSLRLVVGTFKTEQRVKGLREKGSFLYLLGTAFRMYDLSLVIALTLLSF